MLINGRMKEGRVKSNLIYENIYWSSALIFIPPFLWKKENNEADFTIKGMMGPARTAEWTNVNYNDISFTPSLI